MDHHHRSHIQPPVDNQTHTHKHLSKSNGLGTRRVVPDANRHGAQIRFDHATTPEDDDDEDVVGGAPAEAPTGGGPEGGAGAGRSRHARGAGPRVLQTPRALAPESKQATFSNGSIDHRMLKRFDITRIGIFQREVKTKLWVCL